VRIEQLHSAIFDNDRKLRILLPAGYDAPANAQRVYPVLFLNDGQNLFDSTTAIFGRMEWRVDETVDSLIAHKLIPPVIVVGIDNAGRRGRAREYLPYPDEFLSPPEASPRGKQYPEFLVSEVLPFVRSRYRVAHDRDHVGVGGSSYGAIAALYSALRYPDVFGLLLIESPSLYVDSARVLSDVETSSWLPQRVYLGVGTNEEGRPGCEPQSPLTTDAESDVYRLKNILSSKGVPSNRIDVVVAPCAVHNEAAWARRLPAAMRFLFGP
jgi:enterochelin esterase-like enzyme